jgi:hypothetical protein
MRRRWRIARVRRAEKRRDCGRCLRVSNVLLLL